MSEVTDRISRLAKLLERIQPIPEEWVKGRGGVAVRRGRVELECLDCQDWGTLVLAWRKSGL